MAMFIVTVESRRGTTTVEVEALSAGWACRKVAKDVFGDAKAAPNRFAPGLYVRDHGAMISAVSRENWILEDNRKKNAQDFS